MKEKILVSACLLGTNCKYNGGNNYSEEVMEFLRDYEIIPICPEIMGGLPTPRPASEIKGNNDYDYLELEDVVVNNEKVDNALIIITQPITLINIESSSLAKNFEIQGVDINNIRYSTMLITILVINIVL